MAEYRAPGLTGDWLNGWLAAVGITVLLPDVRLAWTDDPVPVALFEVPDGEDLPTKLAAAIPDEDWLDKLVISGLSRTVTFDEYRNRCSSERYMKDGSLSSCVTDLVADVSKEVRHSEFDPPAPKGSTTESRLRMLWPMLGMGDERATVIEQSLQGLGARRPALGLGFDMRRLSSGVHASNSGPQVDPVVEVLCFFGLRLVPVRGDGSRSLPRGWSAGRGPLRRFCWPVWDSPLDFWAIDAIIDHVGERADPGVVSRLGVRERFVTVPYRALGSSDVTRGFASHRLS